MSEKNKTTISQKIMLFIMPVIISFVVLEIGVRLFDMFRGESFFTDYRNELNNVKPIVPYRMFGFAMYKGEVEQRQIASRHQELFSLQKTPDTIRVVCFGGSTTENLPAFKEPGVHYPKQLQALLSQKYPNKKIEVINLGNSAYATNHSLMMLAFNVLSWQPDIVILSHNINDLLASYFPDFSVDYDNKYGTEYYLPNHADKYSTLNVLFQHSSFYWFVKGKIDKIILAPAALHRESYAQGLPQINQEVFRRNVTSFVNLAKNNNVKELSFLEAINLIECKSNEEKRRHTYTSELLKGIFRGLKVS